jgi:TrkA domain protein
MEPGSQPSLTSLPGVGARLDLTDADGRPVRVVRRRSGHLEVHVDEAVVELEPAAAAALGAFASGHFRLVPEVAERLEGALGGLAFDWVRVTEGAAAVGRTIEELQVRRRTGVTIVAILRGSLPIVAPDPSARLEVGDDLVIAGRDQDREGFERYLVEGG